jgi:hypothetical protein
MTVNELIKLLSQVVDKEKEIYFFSTSEYESLSFENYLLELDDQVLVGNDIPAELHEKDYKYER